MNPPRPDRQDGEGTNKPRLLFLGHNLPWPPDSGAKIRSFHFLRLLARDFRVHAICLYRAQHLSVGLPESQKELGELVWSLDAFAIPGSRELMHLIWDHARSISSRRPYTVYSYQSRRFRERLQDQLVQSPPDLVHVDSLDLSGYLPLLSGLPVACGHHNVESELLARRAERDPSRSRSLYISHQSALTRKEEEIWAPRVSLNVTCSEQDEKRLRAIAPAARTVVVPNGVDTEHFRPRTENGQGLVFLGGSDWFPNKSGMDFFAAQVLPSIRSRRADLPVTWIGRATDAEKRDYGTRYGIRMVGRVEDIRPHLEAASCMIVPLLTGGGTRLKILDGWSMGKPVVTTSIGCEGLLAKDGENCLIRDGSEDFAEAILEIHGNPQLRRRLETGARQTAVSHYDWEQVGKGLREEYDKLL